jgi:hypothetical protein
MREEVQTREGHHVDGELSKVEAAWKAGDDLEIPVFAAALRAGVEFDKIAGARGGVGKDF